MEEIFKRILGKLKGLDFWIALFFVVAEIVSWEVIGATKAEDKEVLNRRLGVAVTLAVVAVSVIAVRRFFNRERRFSKKLRGILVMRIAGDDEKDSLQRELIANLNGELQKESTDQQIEVHASREMLDESRGLADAHSRARRIGQRRKAALVIWGQKVGDKKFFPRITFITKEWMPMSERTHEVQSITELRLPDILVDEPFYLLDLAVGVSYYRDSKYQDALPRFKAALQRKGASPDELAELQFLTAFCDWSVSVSQKKQSSYVEEAIELFEKAAKAFQPVDQQKWAMTQMNLGVAYRALQIGDRVANVQRAIAACEAALSFFTEEKFPIDWAGTQNNLGVAYFYLPTGNRAANLQKAITAYEAALRVRTEKDFPADWAMTQNNLGNVYRDFPADQAVNVQKAITAYQAALKVQTEKEFPVDWAMTQNNLGLAYLALPTLDSNLQKAIAAFEAALSVYTEKDVPVEWAKGQLNLGLAYSKMSGASDMKILKKAKEALEAALWVFDETRFPDYHGLSSELLCVVDQQLSGTRLEKEP